MIRALNKVHITQPQRQVVRFFASIALALALLYLVRLEFPYLAVLLALASKWQVVLGGPRLWLHNLWDNVVDIVFILSIIALLTLYTGPNVVAAIDNGIMQLGVVGLYLMWQLLIKPLSGVTGHSIQALLMLAIAITVIFIMKSAIGIAGMIGASWLVALAAADHFLISITDDTALRQLLMAVWGLIVAQTVWIFGHWLVFYPFLHGQVLIPQAALAIVAMGYIFGTIYYDHHYKRLSRKRLYSYLVLITGIMLVLIIGSEWVSRV